MRRILFLIAGLFLCASVEARRFVIDNWAEGLDPTPLDGNCNVTAGATGGCSVGAALMQPYAGEIDTIVFPRAEDSVRAITWFGSMIDVAKPVVIEDSSFLATGLPRLRLEGISLRFNMSPVVLRGISFIRAGQNRSSVALMASGPDTVQDCRFNLTPSDSATDGLTAWTGMLVGPLNRGTLIERNRFGGFGSYSTAVVALRVYGDSTKILRNTFGLSAAGVPVPFEASAISVGSTLSYGVGGESDTVYAPVGGIIDENTFALCSYFSRGIGFGTSTAEGGTRGWKIRRNRIGVDSLGQAIAGCAVQDNPDATGIALTGNNADPAELPMTGMLISENLVGQVPNGIQIYGEKVQYDTIRDNQVGAGALSGSWPIGYNGILVLGRAKHNLIRTNLVGSSRVGLRLGWGTGKGDGDSNEISFNRIGHRDFQDEVVPNDTGVVFDYTSHHNLFTGNRIAGNRLEGIALVSAYLGVNQIDRNDIGRTNAGTRRPNGGAGLKSSEGAGGQTITNNRFSSSGTWAVDISRTTRKFILEGNTFQGGQDSGAILVTNSDSVQVLGNTFDTCARACVVLRAAQKGSVSKNRFGGASTAITAENVATLSFKPTSGIALDSNVLPRIAVPIDLLGNAGYTPNDPADGDAGPMGLLNHPLLKAVSTTADSLFVTYDLDLSLSTGAPRIWLYAALPDSSKLVPLGSWAATAETGVELRVRSPLALPAGTTIRAALIDVSGNSSELDSGKVLGGGSSVGRPALQVGLRIRAGSRPSLELERASIVEWEILGMDGRHLGGARETLESGRHELPIPRSARPRVLWLSVDGIRQILAVPPAF